MGKLRRIDEVGDGNFEQIMQKNASIDKSDLQKAKERKKNLSLAASKNPPKIKEDWEKISGSLRVEQKSFNPKDFSPYDTSAKSVRRYASDIKEVDTPFDITTTTSYSHLFSDPGSELKAYLKESMERRIAMEEEKERRLRQKMMENEDWEREREMWAQAKKRNIKANEGFNKVAHENVVDSKFGKIDYDAIEKREEQYKQMIENMYQKHKSIKDSRLEISKEQRRAQWENEENIRSQSIQQKLSKSMLVNKLAELYEN